MVSDIAYCIDAIYIYIDSIYIYIDNMYIYIIHSEGVHWILLVFCSCPLDSVGFSASVWLESTWFF